MARGRHREEHENHERWLISYADLLTLMFAFFVVMYAVSSVNEGKFRVLANSLVASFRTPNQSLEPIQVGELIKPTASVTPINVASRAALNMPQERLLVQVSEGEQFSKPATDGDLESTDLDLAAERIRAAMAPLIEQGTVEVRHMKHWLEIEMKASILFASGSARLEPEALPVLEQLAGIVRHLENPLEVEGYTDNVPISTTVFPSNWELSAARSASVVRLFAEKGVQPQRMVAIGFGEHRPIAENTTEQGRSRNRRVVVSILMHDQARHFTEPPLVEQPGAEHYADRIGNTESSQTRDSLSLSPVEKMLVTAER
jgi:chemotaxis protein MotB